MSNTTKGKGGVQIFDNSEEIILNKLRWLLNKFLFRSPDQYYIVMQSNMTFNDPAT